MSTSTRSHLHQHATARWLTFLIVLVAAILVLLFLSRAASAQGIGFAGDDPQKYGEMYRTYQREHNQALQDLDDEVAAIRRQGNSPGENQQAIEKAYSRFMERSGKLDARYRQPVLKKMLDVANLRVADFVKTTPVSSQSTGHVDPSTPITPSKGTQSGQPGYRQGLSDTDAAGGARAVDHLTGIAREMGLTPDDGARLFDLKAGYSTTTDDSLLLTAHKSGRLDRVGSNAWQTQIEVDARSKETSLHVNMQPDQAGRDYVAVRDHQRKALDGLQTPGTDLLPEPGQGTNLKGAEKLQGMVKGTLKSLDVAGLSDEALARLIQKHGIGGSPAKLRNVLGLLKGGRAIIPESVGLTTENIENFKSLCGDIIDESVQVTKAKANAELQDRLAQRDQLEATGDKADREQARKIREEIIDSRKRMQEVERAVVRNEIDDLQKQRDSVVAPTDDGQTKTPNDPETEAARKRKLAEIDREIDARRVKQAVRDLYADVERRKTVSGTAVVNDLERPRRPRPLPPEFTRQPPEVPPAQRESVLTHPAVNRGLFVAGGLIATYEALKEEYYEAEKRLREKRKGTPDEDRPLTNREIMAEVSYTRATARTALSLTGIEGAWLAGQKAKYEWVKGTNDYIEAEVDRYHRAGYDELPLGASLTIMIKATIRQTSLSVYQGVKGVPILGDLVGFPETLFVLTEAGIGALYDPWKADQLEKYQVMRGERDAARATLTVEPLVRHIENLATAAGLQVRTLESLDQSSRDADIDAEKLRDRFRADIQALEKLLEKIGEETETPVVVPDIAVLGRLFDDIATLTREATEFSLRCDRLERDLKGGKIECSTIREQDQELSVELVNQGLSRGLIQEKYASLEQTLQKLGPTADARRIVLRLQETTDYARRLSENLSRTSRQIPQLVENHRVLRANQELLRERVLHYCDVFQPRAAPGSETQEWADYRRRIDAARIDMAPFKNATAIGQRFDVTAQHLELIARTELPELPIALQPRRVSDGQLSGELESLKQPMAAMTAALEKATDKLDGLRQLCPAPKPAFEITAKVGDGLRVQFEVTGKSLAAPAKRFFIWDFGDESRLEAQQPTCAHSYPKPGKYTVEVRVFEEKEKFSADLGVVSTTITLKGRSTTPGSSPPAGPAVTGLKVNPGFTIAGAVVPPEGGVILGQLKPGQYLGDGVIGIQLSQDRREVTYDFNISIQVKLSTQHYKGPAGLRGFVPPFWRLSVVGNGRGAIDPQSGRFQGSSEDAKWTESVAGVDQDGGRAEGRQLIGLNPDRLPWSGRIEGTVDWKGFRGGEGTLEINQLVRGTWKHAAGNPYLVTLPADIEFNGRQPTLRLFPNEVSCQKSYDILSRGQFGGYRKPLPDVGDRAIWTQNKGILAQFGRWQLTMQGYPFMQGTPERFLPLLEKVEKFIPTSGWENSIPEQKE